MAGQILLAGGTFAISDGSTTVNTNAVQTLTLTASGGPAVFGYAGGLQGTDNELTSPLVAAGTLTGTALQAALQALPNIGVNGAGLPNVAVSPATSGTTGPWTVTFQNDLGNQPVQPLTLNSASALTGGTITIAQTTPGSKAGGVYAAVARLTDIVFPNTKKDVKEVTNFDSTGLTKEYIGGYINPGDVALNAQWIGDVTQDWRTGVIAKFYNGKTYGVRTNVPNKIPQPGAFTPGVGIWMNGFLTDGSPMGAKHDDVLGVKGSFQISGLPIFGDPVQ